MKVPLFLSGADYDTITAAEMLLESAKNEVAMTDVNINFTDAAAEKVAGLIAEEENHNLNLRVFITGGGCSGFQYGFTFDETTNPDDFKITRKVNDIEVRLLIDPMSFQYLQGATIDYRSDINGEQFVIKNPNAKTTCGCGSSFSVEDK